MFEIENPTFYDGSELSVFMVFAALSAWDTIGSHGARNFMLCRKPQTSTSNVDAADGNGTTALSRRGSGSWRAWFNKSLTLKVSSH